MPTAKILYQSILWRGLYYFSAFLLNILIARHFKAAESGSIYFIINIFTLAHLLCSLSIDSGIIYFVSKKELDPSRLFNFSILWTILTGIILLAVLPAFISVSYNNISRTELTVYCIFFICGNLLYNFCAGLFYAQNNFLIPNIISLSFNLMLLLCLPFNGNSLLPVITDGNYFYFYFASFPAQALAITIAYYWLEINEITFKLPAKIEFIKLLKYSLFALAGNAAFFLLYRIDYWFVEKYCTTAALGNYIQVSKLGQLFFILPSILATAIFPITASDSKNNILSWLALLSRFFLFFYAGCCLVLVLSGYWLFPFVFGKSFGSMYIAFIFLVPGILSLSALFTLTAYNGGKNKLKANMMGCLLALMVVIAGNWVLVPQYGINAAAGVSSMGYIVYEIYLLYDFKKENDIKLSSFFIFRFEDIITLKKLLLTTKTKHNGI